MRTEVAKLYGHDVTVYTPESLAEYVALPHPVVIHMTPEFEAEILALYRTGTLRSERFYERVLRLYAARP